MAHHELKSWTTYYDAVASGVKTFEVRLNDRNFQPGDTLTIRETDGPEGLNFTGRKLERRITYVTAFQQRPGFVVFGIVPQRTDGLTEEIQHQRTRQRLERNDQIAGEHQRRLVTAAGVDYDELAEGGIESLEHGIRESVRELAEEAERFCRWSNDRRYLLELARTRLYAANAWLNNALDDPDACAGFKDVVRQLLEVEERIGRYLDAAPSPARPLTLHYTGENMTVGFVSAAELEALRESNQRDTAEFRRGQDVDQLAGD